MRNRIWAALLAVALSLCVAASASIAFAQSNPVAPAISPVQDAWRRYHETISKLREGMLADPLAQDPVSRAQGLYLLQSLEVVGFNTHIAPRTQYPALYVQSIYMPFELSWGFPTPDFLYHDGFIDGAHTYRIYGNKGKSYWSTLQVLKGLWGEDTVGDVAFVDFDSIPYQPNGDFEIFLGPNPPAQTDGKYWVKTDSDLHHMWLLLREVFYDWNRDRPMDLHIEILDRDPGAPITFDENELAVRIDKAGKFVEGDIKRMHNVYQMFKKDKAAGNETIQRNVFASPNLTTTASWGGNPIACYGAMIYDIKPDEALVLDMEVVPARFWGIQLGSVWQQAADGFHHFGSLNGAQSRLDADGRVRWVVSLQDPGVPNWLDPVGVGVGMADLRWYKYEYKERGCPLPKVTKVKLKDLRRHLPKDTPIVTAEQRRKDLLIRRDTSLYRYGQ